MVKVLVVGAGMAGAVYARTLAEHGDSVTVIDKRDHIAGNCFDFVADCGVRVHKYGPHLFHTSNPRVVEWLSRFTEWTPYEHRVVALLDDGRKLTLPINIATVNGVYGAACQTAEQVRQLLAKDLVVRSPIVTAEDHLFATIGPRLTHLFFAPYTEKMWGMSLAELSPEVVRRVQVRIDTDDRYFPGETFQAMPKHGYTAMFEAMLRRPNIEIRLSTPFEPAMLGDYDFCCNSMPIDEFFDYCHGELPYRSIKFHVVEQPRARAPENVVINYTDAGPFTRETWWHNIPGHVTAETETVLKTVEEPCDYRENHYERYYPVKTSDDRHNGAYLKYKEKAKSIDRLEFIGRCGAYQYLDMHQVVNQSLMGAERLIAGRTG